MVHRSVLALIVTSLCSAWVSGQQVMQAPMAATFAQAVAYYEGPVASSPEEISIGWRSVMSKDGSRVAMNYGSWISPGEIRIFDVKTGESLYRFPLVLGGRGLALLPTGNQFATGDFNGNFTVRNFSDGEIAYQWKLDKGSIESISFNHDGSKAFIGSNADYAAQVDTKTGQFLMLYEGHDQVVFDAVLSQDQSLLATSSMNGKIIVYKTDTGEVLHNLSHPGQVAALAWIGKEEKLVSVSSDSRLCVWNAKTGKLVKDAKAGTRLYSVDVDEESNTIVAGGQDSVSFWNAETLEPIKVKPTVAGDAEPFIGHTSLVFGARFIGRDKVLSSGWDQKLILWDRTTGKIDKQFERRESVVPAVVALQSNADMSVGYVAREDGSVTKVDLATLQSISSFKYLDNRKIAAISLGKDNRLLIATTDGILDQANVDFKDVSSSTLKQIATLSEPPIALRHVSDSEIIFVTAEGNLTRLNLKDGKVLQTLSLGGSITSAAWSGVDGVVICRNESEVVLHAFEVTSQGSWVAMKSDGRRLSPGGQTKILPISPDKMFVQNSRISMVSDTKDFRTSGYVPGLNEQPSALAVSGDGTVLLVGTRTGKLQLYQSQIRQVSPIANVQLPFGEFRFASFLKDGLSIRIGSKEGQFFTVSSKNLSLVEEPIQLPRFGIASANRPAERNFVAVGAFNGDAILLNFENFEVLCQLSTQGLKGTGKAGAIAISDDRKKLAVGTDDGIARVYDVESVKLICESENFNAPINDLCFSPDGLRVAASAGDHRLQNKGGLTAILNSKDGKTFVKWEESGHMVTGVRFSPDGKKLMSCGSDKLRTYDVENRKLLHAANDVVGCKRVQFVDDHRCIVTSYPGIIRLWNTKTNRVIANFSGHVKPAGGSVQPMLWAIDVSDDGKFLVTGDLLGQLYLWPIP